VEVRDGRGVGNVSGSELDYGCAIVRGLAPDDLETVAKKNVCIAITSRIGLSF
jgi:hypothetical protein